MAPRYGLLLFLCIVTVTGSLALSDGEESAIQAIVLNFPRLASASPPWTSNASNACSSPGFYGVSCNDGHITALQVAIKDLKGTFPAELGGLLWLETLSFRNVCYSGELPTSFHQLQNLSLLEVSGDANSPCSDLLPTKTTFTTALCSLGQLKSLRLSLATLSGTLPSCIGSLTSLEHLYLETLSEEGHKIEGVITSSFSNLIRLQTLYLVRTSFSGFQDADSLALPDLEELSLYGSRVFSSSLDGMILSAERLRIVDLSFTRSNIHLYIFNQVASSLTYLSLDDISLSGETISSIFSHPYMRLRYLSLANCALLGPIVPFPAYLQSLTYLDLTGNNILQPIPPALMLLPLETFKISAPFTILPDNIGMLNATIRYLEMDSILMSGNTIPTSITALEKLEFLVLRSGGLIGPIPDISNFKELVEADLSDNSLTGPIPDFESEKLRFLNIHGNLLNGTIPRRTASVIAHLDLSYNQFEGAIDQDLFSSNQRLIFLNLAQNRFSGPLPRLHPELPPISVDMTSNKFDGEVPTSYCQAQRLSLSDNQLSGSPDFLSYGCLNLTYLALDHNGFVGDFNASWIQGLTSLETLKLAHNHFKGALPTLPSNVKVFDASYNSFSSLNIHDWIASPGFDSLVSLELSKNRIPFPFSFLSLIGPNLTELAAGWNNFLPSSRIARGIEPFPKLISLDIRASTSGSFPDHLFPSMTVLRISLNSFEGKLDLSRLPSITLLDMSNNFFKFDVSTFSSLRLLTSVSAQWNNLYGTLVLKDLPNLQTANFSFNGLNLQPHLASIGSLFASSQLTVLDITENPIPPFQSIETETMGLARTSSSEPLLAKPKIVDCHGLSFYGKASGSFIFDTDLFSFLQCDCNQAHFGMPPNDCIKCPSSGTENCHGQQSNVSSNYYAYFTLKKKDTRTKPPHLPPPSRFLSNFEIPSYWTLSSSDTSSSSEENVRGDLLEPLDHVAMETESCLVKTVQLLSQKSNCQGILLTGPNIAHHNSSLQELLLPQCREGSDGRLCSRCVCDLEKDESCFFVEGYGCTRCKHTFHLSTSIPLAIAALVIIIAVVSAVTAVVLQRKRIQSLQNWNELSTLKRILYRLVYLTSLGNISILITFLQMLLQFTEWEAYAQLSFLRIINGDGTGLGLRCFFPFLAEPMWAQLFQLSIPFVALIVLTVSIGIGSLVADYLTARKKRRLAQLNGMQSGEDASLLPSADKEAVVEYPTLALLSSLSITVVKFFYFGAALTAHQYLFSSRASTGVIYSQSEPWMKATEAKKLVLVSIPALLIFDLGLPVAFIVLCWKVRKHIKLPSVLIYFGSLFETYHPRCFWWELVTTLKKLSIALVLKAFSSSDAIQSAMIVSILSGSLVLQATMNPWRRKIENLFDTVSSLVLISALLSTRPSALSNIEGVVWYIAAISGLFTVASAGIVLWQTITGKTDFEKRLTLFLASQSPTDNELSVSHQKSDLMAMDHLDNTN